jgi:hypothetical protein
MQFLRLVPIILVWGRHVIQAVMVMEGVVRGNKSGPEKKAAVLALLSGVAKEMKLPWGPAVIEVLSDLIDTTVKVLNLRGIFTAPAMVPDDIAATVTLANENEIVPNLSEVIEQDPALEAFLAKFAR